MTTLGLDPGVAGAWAALNDLGDIIAAGDLPVAGEGAQRMVSAPLLAAIVQRYRPEHSIIERVGAMPKQGVSSTFKFGRSLGVIEGVLGALGCSSRYVPAAVWKRHLQLGNDKEQSRQRAIETWPTRADELFSRIRDHNRAEAALIALWGLRCRLIAGGANE